MNRIFKFVTEKRVELFVLGINISAPKIGSRESRFQIIVGQMASLTDE